MRRLLHKDLPFLMLVVQLVNMRCEWLGFLLV